ncbi:MAG: 5'/3'-nucleotidase SurE, partial [Pseudomonadota bacterium]
GTVAGAIEGTLLGIRSIAISQGYSRSNGKMLPWETAEALAPDLLSKLIKIDMPDGSFLNVNFPHCAPEDAQGVIVTRQGKVIHGIDLDKREDGRGFPYYWLRFSYHTPKHVEGTDLSAIASNKVSVTPLKLDMTDYSIQERVAEALD